VLRHLQQNGKELKLGTDDSLPTLMGAHCDLLLFAFRLGLFLPDAHRLAVHQRIGRVRNHGRVLKPATTSTVLPKSRPIVTGVKAA
jgi:hypothetical protein